MVETHPCHINLGLSQIEKYQERVLLNPHKGIGVACTSRRNCIATAPYSFPQCIAVLNRNKPYSDVKTCASLYCGILLQ